MDKCPEPIRAITRSTSHKVRSWEDDSDSGDGPAALPCGVHLQADKSNEGEGSSGAVTHAGNANVEKDVPVEQGSLAAEKEINAKDTVDKSVGSKLEQHANRGTATKEASGHESVVHTENRTKKKRSVLRNNG